MKPIFDTLTEIAARHLNIPTLLEHRGDGLDFHDVSVWGVKDALWAAYQAGLNASAVKPSDDGAAHTPAPWDRDGTTRWYAAPSEDDAFDVIEIRANVTEAGWETVAFVPAACPGAGADARRIVAAVNACEGIGTETLEKRPLPTIKEALQMVSNYMSDDLDERDATEMRIFRAVRTALGLMRHSQF